jgi:hypothetical protein
MASRDLHSGSILINRAPRGYEAGLALKAGTAAALIADHERKAVATRIPNLDVFNRSNDATELHDTASEGRPERQMASLIRLAIW